MTCPKLPTGKRKFGNIEFNVLNPAANHGKAALAFANKARPYFLKTATVNTDGNSFDYLYFYTPRPGAELEKSGPLRSIMRWLKQHFYR